MDAFSTMAFVQSSAALAASESARASARKAECISITQSYNPTTATVQDMRGYADCVEVLYPLPVNASVVLFFRIAVLVMVISAITVGWKERDGDIIEIVMCGLMGAFVGFLISLFGALILWAIGIL